jgi:hypothetical protein
MADIVVEADDIEIENSDGADRRRDSPRNRPVLVRRIPDVFDKKLFHGLRIDIIDERGNGMNHKQERGIQGEERQLLAKWPDVLISILGFFLALSFNSWINRQGDHETYQAILKELKKEAGFNKATLDMKLEEVNAGQLPVGDLSIGVLAQALSNPLFVTHAGDQNLTILEQYLADSTRVGAFRRSLENIALSSLSMKEKNQFSGYLYHKWQSAENLLEVDLYNVNGMK